MAKTISSNLSLSEVFDAMVAAGAVTYLWCDGGVSTGTQVVRLGDDHAITVDEMDGYKLFDWSELEGAELVEEGDYDDDAAIRAASDLDGYFGVVGIPGSQHHAFEFFEDQTAAHAWVQSTWEKATAENPAMGTLESCVLTASEAFDLKYRDGNRIYFRAKEACQAGFTPAGE